ncbi:hypothetical protein CK501_15955 [Halovibrio salipaludis]|uniref:DUF2523 domain-containing protein n=1 Tax=Halovibrio salipaludis TaxID=2032626 RepID=A0A2A2EVM1_9GAMM|nr:DUF2523 family protein [Halovibrio salipaludis]PAU76429.1 hypothetical protein CK501_15955 [Halovibrio salipaludis]
MWGIVVRILQVMSGFFIASLIARIAGLVVWSGVSMVLVDYVMEQIESAASGAPQEWLQIAALMGIWEALGIIIGAWAFRLMLDQFSIGPSAAITGGS